LSDNLGEHFNYKIVEIPGTRPNPLLIGSRYKQTESPFGFLSLIYYADMVVSTSFHGVAFSVLFEKEFYCIGLGNNSDRVVSLLNSLGIDNRYLDSIEDYNIDMHKKIDYKLVKAKLNPLVNDSQSFIINNIKNVDK